MSSKITGPNDPRVQAYVGKKFHRLTAIRFIGMKPSQMWEFKCDCGGSKTTLLKNVLKGLTGSCGCLHKEYMQKFNHVHGHAVRGKQHPLYKIWKSMFHRCRDKSQKSYGGKGITVCPAWNSFESFFNDMAPTYVSGLTIGRNENDKGYSKENCQWENRTQQSRNRSNVALLESNGEKLAGSEWSERLNGNSMLVYVRLRRGWSVKRAVSTPPVPPHFHKRP